MEISTELKIKKIDQALEHLKNLEEIFADIDLAFLTKNLWEYEEILLRHKEFSAKEFINEQS